MKQDVETVMGGITITLPDTTMNKLSEKEKNVLMDTASEAVKICALAHYDIMLYGEAHIHITDKGISLREPNWN